jgi:hypothetical protein
VVLLLAAVGTVAGFRRHALMTALLLGVSIAGVMVIAPNSGNIGTLVRHRDMIVPFVVCLAAMGAAHLMSFSPRAAATAPARNPGLHAAD